MKQEDKQLLLKDLSARLPYGVIVDYSYNAFDIHNGNYVKHGSKCILKCYLLDVFISPRQNEKGEYIKPYLRPISSMTEKELHEYNMHLLGITTGVDAMNFMIWIYQHHLDIFHFIEKGLAIEVTKENNPYKE